MRGALALLVLTACGRFYFSELVDASSDAPLGAFQPPLPCGALSHPLTDDDPTATGDALEMYFASERVGMAGGFADIFVSRRGSRSDEWGTPQNVTELNSTDEDQSPGVSSDGLTLYFSSRRPSPLGGTSSNIWMSTRPSRAVAWSPPVFVAELSTTMDEFEPQPDETNLRLVLYRQIGLDREVMIATRATVTDAWGTPALIPNVNGTTDERSPCLRANGLELWFTSDRYGPAMIHDIFVATRTSNADAFSTPVSVTAINSGSDDNDPWISPDGRVLLMASDRTGNQEIYEAQR